MKVIEVLLNDVLLIKPKQTSDQLGFYESFSSKDLQKIGIDISFVQDNIVHSTKNILRGLHYQVKHPQGKFIKVLKGTIFDVAVDLRLDSKNFGKSTSFILSKENGLCAWIPPGYAHGYYVISNDADVSYKVTEYRYEKYERILFWNDKNLHIQWPFKNIKPIVSEKDSTGINLDLIEKIII